MWDRWLFLTRFWFNPAVLSDNDLLFREKLEFVCKKVMEDKSEMLT
jgi:hypothetical protein